MKLILIIIIFTLLLGCSNEGLEMKEDIKLDSELVTAKATFAGGCFWCMEAAFEDSDGVIDVVSGYSGGAEENPTYKQVLTGTTGHKEVVQITYDPSKVKYEELLEHFWKQIDPTDAGGQFSDRGSQYETAIFYHDEDQRIKAEKSKADLEKSGNFQKPIVTKILPFASFHKAEEYHQDYSKKRTLQYKLYEKGSGRAKFKEEMWGS